MTSEIFKIVKFLTENIILSNFIFGSYDIESVGNLSIGKSRIEENRIQYSNFYLESGVFIDELKIFQIGSTKAIDITILLDNHQNYSFNSAQPLLPKEYFFISSKYSIDGVVSQDYKYKDALKEFNIVINFKENEYITLTLNPEYQPIIPPVAIVSKKAIENLAGEIVKTGTLTFESAESIDALYEMLQKKYLYLNKEYFVKKFNALAIQSEKTPEFVKEKVVWLKDTYTFIPSFHKELSYSLSGEAYDIWRSQIKIDCQNILISGTLVTYSDNTFEIIVENIKAVD